MAPQQPCPDTRLLQALLENGLPEEQQVGLTEHIEECRDCRNRLEELAGGAELPSAVVGPARQEPSEESPAFRELYDEYTDDEEEDDYIL